MYDRHSPIEEFLNAAAARQPTPGGGSITALCGAMAASMGEMVINYSLGKKELAGYEGELRPAIAQLTRARTLLLDLVVEDQNAFAALNAVKKLPDGPQRDQQLAAALLDCIRTPEAMGSAAVAILQICDQIINFVNFHLLSDLAVCSDLAMATARCAVYNVRVNLAEVTEPANRQRIESNVGQMLTRAAALIQRISPRIWARHSQGT